MIFDEYKNQIDDNLIQYLSFDVKENNISRPKAYYKSLRKNINLDLLDEIGCEISDEVRYPELDEIKLEFKPIVKSKSSFEKVIQYLDENIVFFDSNELMNRLNKYVDIDLSLFIFSITYSTDLKLIKKISITVYVDKNKSNLPFDGEFERTWVGIKFKNFEIEEKLYCVANKKEDVKEQIQNISAQYGLHPNLIDVPFDELDFFGLGIINPFSNNPGLSYYFFPSRKGKIARIGVKNDYIIRKNTGIYFIIEPHKRYDLNTEIIKVNGVGYKLLEIIKEENNLSIDYLITLFIKCLTNSIDENLYAEIYKDVEKFVINMAKKDILEVEFY